MTPEPVRCDPMGDPQPVEVREGQDEEEGEGDDEGEEELIPRPGCSYCGSRIPPNLTDCPRCGRPRYQPRGREDQ
jgi:hypothetical protein